jgi:hypothetical protein
MTVRRPDTLRWTLQDAARVSFTLAGHAHSIVVKSRAGTGQINLPPNTYRNLRISTRGRWTIELR